MTKLNTLARKKVAIFGLGDQVSYTKNYPYATGEIHDVFKNLVRRDTRSVKQARKSIQGDQLCCMVWDSMDSIKRNSAPRNKATTGSTS
jgi:flavodoxin